MNASNRIVGMLGHLTSFQMVRSLSQQIELSSRGKQVYQQGFIGRTIQRMIAAHPSPTFGERLGLLSPQDQKRLNISQANLSYAQQAHAVAQNKRDAAEKDLTDEQANSTGRNVVALEIALIDLEEQFKKASEVLKQATEQDLKVRAEIAAITPKSVGLPEQLREARTLHQNASAAVAVEQANPTGKVLGQFQAAANTANKALEKLTTEADGFSPSQAVRTKKTRSSQISILHPIKSFERLLRLQRVDSRGNALDHADRVKRIGETADRSQHANPRNLVRTGNNHRISKNAVKTAPTWVNWVKTVMTDARVSGAGARAAGGIAGRGVALGGARIGSGVAMKHWTDRQYASAESVIQQQIAPKIKYSMMVDSAMNRREFQQRQLDLKNAGETQETSSAVVESTMRLKQAKSDKENRWENVSNKVLIILNDVATNAVEVLNRLDIVAPAVEATLDSLEEWFGWEKNEAAKSKKIDDPTVEKFRETWGANMRSIWRGEQPRIPDVKRPG